MKYIKKYMKYSKKNKKYDNFSGGNKDIFDLEEFDITAEWKNTEYLNINDKIYIRIKEIGKGSYGNVYLYASEDGEFYAIKDYGDNINTEKNYEKEKNNYEKIKELELDTFFPKSIFVNFEYDFDKKYYLIMEKMEKIGENIILEFRNNFDSFIVFMRQIIFIMHTMHKKNIYYTDLKLQNIVFKDGDFYLIDFGGLCFPPDFDCENTYFYIDEKMKTAGDILFKDFEGVKNMYKLTSKITGLSPTTPTIPPIPPRENNIEYYLIFLFIIVILQIFDDNCSLMFYPEKILQSKDFEKTIQEISICKNKILEQIERSMVASNYESQKINEIRKFIKKLFWGEIFSISIIEEFLGNI
jgi:serine/threonine protein kinase